MKTKAVLLLLITGLVPPAGAVSLSTTTLIERIGMGSCNEVRRSQAFWGHITPKTPQLFLFLGDNIYKDFHPDETYANLGAVPGFQTLMAAAQPLPLWSDHDYGQNNAGGGFGGKEASKQDFIQFWKSQGALPPGSLRETRTGNYDSVIFGPPGRQVQLIMLDGRYFRGVEHPESMLGAAQWTWLESELQKPANLRLILSDVYMLGELDNDEEGWPKYNADLQKMFTLLQARNVKGAFIISGDLHFAQLSRRDGILGYPLYDLTVSMMSASQVSANANAFREGSPVEGQNFGLLTIDWAPADPVLTFQVFSGVNGTERLKKVITLGHIGSGKGAPPAPDLLTPAKPVGLKRH